MTLLDHAYIGVGDAARAAGIHPTRLLQWLDRGQIAIGPQDKPTTGSGDPRQLTLRRVLAFAIAAALHGRGIPVKVAYAVAAKFADEGSVDRAPGHLFLSGPTWLIADGPLPESARILNEAPSPSAPITIAVDLCAIVSVVKQRLAARRAA